MKRTTLLFTLTLGLAALNASAQSQGDQARQRTKAPEDREEQEIKKEIRRRGDGPRAERPREMQRQHRQWAQRDDGPAPRDFGGSRRRFGPGRPEFGPQGHGPAWNSPRERGGRPEVCPFCHRPMNREMAQLGPRRGGQGFAPRENFGPQQRNFAPQGRGFDPMQRGFAPQDRGPGFGPPPWAGRGESGEDLRPGPRGPRGPQDDAPPMQRRGFGPRERDSEGPGNPPAPEREDVRP